MLLIEGDITDETSGLILHGVNTQAAMGSGVALAIKNKWPIIYSEYMKQGKGRHLLGSCHIINVEPGLYVANGYTQEFYGYDGKRYADPDAVRSVLYNAFKWCSENKIELKMPKIASARGGLDWPTEVVPLIEQYETIFEIQVKIIYK